MRLYTTTYCKRCGERIAWGEVVETLGVCDDPRKFIPLDPDGMPHVCDRWGVTP